MDFGECKRDKGEGVKSIFEDIKKIAKEINSAIKYGELGYSGAENTTGDEQLKLDVACDKIIENIFKQNSTIKAIISEEKEDLVSINEDAKYVVCYDPLDGSSIVDVNLSVGSIFGIYEEKASAKNLVSAAYLVFGPRVELVLASKNLAPIHFRLDSDGEFNLLGNISLQEKGKINAPGGTQKNWHPHHKRFIDSLFMEGYRLRYSGGMVPDLHQILLKRGGLFSYPDTTDRPKGKLRALFEVFPFAFIFEQAGGEAVNNRGLRLLDCEISHYHDTLPCFFGSKYEIKKLKEAYANG